MAPIIFDSQFFTFLHRLLENNFDRSLITLLLDHTHSFSIHEFHHEFYHKFSCCRLDDEKLDLINVSNSKRKLIQFFDYSFFLLSSRKIDRMFRIAYIDVRSEGFFPSESYKIGVLARIHRSKIIQRSVTFNAADYLFLSDD